MSFYIEGGFQNLQFGRFGNANTEDYHDQATNRDKLFAWESVRPFAYQNAAFIAKDENRVKLIYVGQGNTVTAELTVIR